ncbi:sensor histidine kinase [Vreelandella salicampi]|uniref:sensor histidine kinase n=1 Tax=Vreelandella salicampi TaxID=1449798 RepID=UPI0030CA2A0B
MNFARYTLSHIFAPFYRGESSGATGRAGLGLAIARGITTLQGGDIRVENLASGGASFCIRLPVYPLTKPTFKKRNNFANWL